MIPACRQDYFQIIKMNNTFALSVGSFVLPGMSLRWGLNRCVWYCKIIIKYSETQVLPIKQGTHFLSSDLTALMGGEDNTGGGREYRRIGWPSLLREFGTEVHGIRVWLSHVLLLDKDWVRSCSQLTVSGRDKRKRYTQRDSHRDIQINTEKRLQRYTETQRVNTYWDTEKQADKKINIHWHKHRDTHHTEKYIDILQVRRETQRHRRDTEGQRERNREEHWDTSSGMQKNSHAEIEICTERHRDTSHTYVEIHMER